MVSNHVIDLIRRYGMHSDIPSALTDYVRAREYYDYSEHSRVGAKHGGFVSDEVCDRFCVLGAPEQVTEKLQQLEALGVDQFNLYLMTSGQDETLAVYGNELSLCSLGQEISPPSPHQRSQQPSRTAGHAGLPARLHPTGGGRRR